MPGATRFLPVSVSYAGGAAAGARADEHAVTANNRFARVVLSFADLAPPETWVELAFQLAWDAAEAATAALDFALVGVDFLAEDRSSLDFEQVPGLTRTLLDPQSAWIPGPAYLAAGEGTRMAMVRLAFLVPDPARHLTVSLRSWRNTAPFTVIRPELRQGGSARTGRRRRLAPQPDWIDLALVPGRPLTVGPGLRLGAAPVWALPDEPSWSEDPFGSMAWRLDYQSLGWLMPLIAADAPRATEIALSWSRANPWGSPADALSLRPVALAGPRLVLASRELNRLRVVPRIVTGQRATTARGACRATCR